jgi:hypothetical protein
MADVPTRFAGDCPIHKSKVIMKLNPTARGHEWLGVCTDGHTVVLRMSKIESVACEDEWYYY